MGMQICLEVIMPFMAWHMDTFCTMYFIFSSQRIVYYIMTMFKYSPTAITDDGNIITHKMCRTKGILPLSIFVSHPNSVPLAFLAVWHGTCVHVEGAGGA